jgi:coenzyme F420-0:L-glutamate ligase/coenzyme F420-1:gamma-L-glutamate ligase
MRLFAIKTPLIKPQDNLVRILLQSLRNQDLVLDNGDVVAVSSKAVAFAQGRLAKLAAIPPSPEADDLASRYSLEPHFAELVRREADRIYGGVKKAILTYKNGVLTVNAGIDRKNAPEGYVALWPANPQLYAENFRKGIKQQTSKTIGIVIVDSDVTPLRLGTRGLALAVAGFRPVRDHRGERDLFHKPLLITRHAVADDLASAAHLLMGETDARTPFILIKDAPITLAEVSHREGLLIPFDECVYASSFKIQPPS